MSHVCEVMTPFKSREFTLLVSLLESKIEKKILSSDRTRRKELNRVISDDFLPMLITADACVSLYIARIPLRSIDYDLVARVHALDDDITGVHGFDYPYDRR